MATLAQSKGIGQRPTWLLIRVASVWWIWPVPA